MTAGRYVIYGAGAVGGTIGARLHQAGHDVTLIPTPVNEASSESPTGSRPTAARPAL